MLTQKFKENLVKVQKGAKIAFHCVCVCVACVYKVMIGGRNVTNNENGSKIG